MSARTDGWLADVRYAARSLRRAPAFTIAAALVLALGIGATTAVFSAVDAVLLARLPYSHDEQLVRIFEQNSPTNRWTLSVVDLEAIERLGRAFAAVGASRGRQVSVSAGRDAERLNVGYITAGFLDALDVHLVAGRHLVAADERPESAPVVIVGTDFADAQFGSAPAALDRTVTIDGITHRVVGVLGRADERLAGRQAQVWPVMRRVVPTRRGPNGLFVIARLRPGVTIDAARRELDAISVRIFPDWQSSFQDKIARLTPYSLREVTIGNAARPMMLFAMAVSLVLLIAVANVASLSVVRSMRRGRELSLRSVLGASRARLARLVITESVLLAVVGGVLGVAVGWASLVLLQSVAVGIPRLETARIGGRALLVDLVVTIVAGVAIGVVPMARLVAEHTAAGLRDGTRGIGDTKLVDRIRSGFVGAEFALALPVLAIGALLLVSITKLQAVNPGFESRDVFTMSVGLPATGAGDNAAVAAFWSRVANSIGQRPGVRGVAFATATPPNDNGNSNNNFNFVDAPVPPGGAEPNVSWASVDRAFFTTLAIPLLEGRMFTASDTGGNNPVVLVTRAWAKHYYPGRSAIGRELISGGCTTCPHTIVIGVVGDVTLDGLGTPGEAVFSPLTEGWPAQLNLFVRTAASRGDWATTIRSAVRSADASAGMGPVQSLDDQVYDSVAQPRHWAGILSAFALAALLMAAVGIFGLLSYAVALRRREIGVRIALGAPSGRVVGSIVGAGMRYALAGSLVGLLLTIAASRWVRGSLYGISAVDPMLLTSVAGGLLVVALIAAWLPARRAAHIDPLEAMRPD